MSETSREVVESSYEAWRRRDADAATRLCHADVQLRFDDQPMWGTAHWKLSAIDRYAGDRPAAWVDDSFNEDCHAWAERREAPTLLVRTDPAVGLTDAHVEKLEAWASALPVS